MYPLNNVRAPLPLWSREEELASIASYQTTLQDWWALIHARTTYEQRVAAWDYKKEANYPSGAEDTASGWYAADVHGRVLRTLSRDLPELPSILRKLHPVETLAYRHNQGLIHAQAFKLRGRAALVGLGIEDLVSDAFISIQNALRKFNPAKGFRFSTYFQWWLRQGMRMTILRAQFIHTSTQVTDVDRRVRSLQREWTQKHGRDLDDDELSTLLAASGKAVDERILFSVRHLRVQLLLDGAPVTHGSNTDMGTPLIELLSAASEEEPGHPMSDVDRAHAAYALVEQLTGRDRDIFMARYPQDPHQEPEALQKVGERHGLTRERVRQIEAKILAWLRASLEQGEANPGATPSPYRKIVPRKSGPRTKSTLSPPISNAA